MKKRMFLMLVAIVVFIFTIGMVKYGQIKKGMAQHAAFKMPPEAVTTVVAKPRRLAGDAVGDRIGRGRARRDRQRRPARASSRRSRSSPARPSGRATCSSGWTRGRSRRSWPPPRRRPSSRSSTSTALTGLRQKGIAAQAEWDRADAEQKQAEARIGEIRATIARKTIRAPFAGVLGIRQVNLGQYLQGGSPIVPLQSTRPVYVNFSVPQQERGRDEDRLATCRSRPKARRLEATGQDHRDRLASSTRRRATSRSRRRSPTRTASCSPGCSSRTSVGLGTASTAIAAAGVGDQLRAVRRLRLHRRGA